MSAYLTAANQLRTVKIGSITAETPTVKSFHFHDRTAAGASPGQFVMIWIPSVDEVPMSLSAINWKEGVVGVTVEEVGEATGSLHRMKAGDFIVIRGPFGRGYALTKSRNVLIVGGGTGLASLAPLAEEITRKKVPRITFVLGAKTFNQLLFLNRIRTLFAAKGKNHTFVATTEDGSYGTKGLATEAAEKLLSEKQFDMIYTCGPELMIHKMLLLAEEFSVPFEASLERFMRCAIGLCGTCVVGRYRVCRDGPVFSGEQLHEVRVELGHFRRGFNGRKIAV